MKVEKLTIRYSTTVPIAAYGVNDKFDWEITLTPYPGEIFNIEEETTIMKKDGDAIVKKLYPHLFLPGKEVWVNPEYKQFIEKETGVNIGGGLFTPVRNIPPPVIDISKEKEQPMLLEDIISSCTEIDGMDGLESYRKLVESQPFEHIKKLFDNKLKELNK